MFRKAAAGSAKNITPMREVARSKAAQAEWVLGWRIGRSIHPVSTANSAASAGAMKAMPPRSWSLSLAALFLSADLGLTPEPREDHAAYIASWLKVLQNDKRAIFTAAAHAERAAAFLHGLQPNAAAADPEREAA
jgi:antirestriction protein ArdC